MSGGVGFQRPPDGSGGGGLVPSKFFRNGDLTSTQSYPPFYQRKQKFDDARNSYFFSKVDSVGNVSDDESQSIKQFIRRVKLLPRGDALAFHLRRLYEQLFGTSPDTLTNGNKFSEFIQNGNIANVAVSTMATEYDVFRFEYAQASLVSRLAHNAARIGDAFELGMYFNAVDPDDRSARRLLSYEIKAVKSVLRKCLRFRVSGDLERRRFRALYNDLLRYIYTHRVEGHVGPETTLSVREQVLNRVRNLSNDGSPLPPNYALANEATNAEVIGDFLINSASFSQDEYDALPSDLREILSASDAERIIFLCNEGNFSEQLPPFTNATVTASEGVVPVGQSWDPWGALAHLAALAVGGTVALRRYDTRNTPPARTAERPNYAPPPFPPPPYERIDDDTDTDELELEEVVDDTDDVENVSGGSDGSDDEYEDNIYLPRIFTDSDSSDSGTIYFGT